MQLHTFIDNKFKAFADAYKNDRNFSLFLAVGFLSGISGGIFSTTFNNFLHDVYHLSASSRGIVEFPRELPGMSLAIVLALLAFLGDIRIASVGMLTAALGMIGLGLFSPTFALMLIFMMVYSLGQHIFMPLAPTIGMSLSKQEQYGMRLGKFNAYNLSATLISYAIVWIGFSYLKMTYQAAFIIAAIFYVLAAFTLHMMKKGQPHHKKFKFIFRKRYTLYYILSMVNGARKQIFLTFAPWVLIQFYHFEPPVFAVLGVVIAVLSIVTRTVVGRAIDRLGEKIVLSSEAVLLIVICMGYAYSRQFLPAFIAVVVISACYILDNSMTAVEMARSTYMRKIAVDPGDVTHTLATGTSLDHVVSMTIPFFGGLLWTACGFQYVFLAAAGIAVINLFLSLHINTQINKA